MLKKKYIISISIFLLVMVTATLSFSNKYDSIEDFKSKILKIGREVKKVESEKSKDKIVLEVGSHKVSEVRFNRVGVYMETKNKKDIEDFIVKHIIIRELAREQGITVSDSEIKEYLNNLKRIINQNEESREDFDAYLEAVNLSYEEFWVSGEIYDVYEKALLTGKYKGHFREKIQSENPNKKYTEVEELALKEIDKRIAAKKNKTKIKRHYK